MPFPTIGQSMTRASDATRRRTSGAGGSPPCTATGRTSRSPSSGASPDLRARLRASARARRKTARTPAARPEQSPDHLISRVIACAESDRPRGAKTLPQQVARGRRVAVAILEQIAQRSPSLHPLDPVGEPVNWFGGACEGHERVRRSNPKSQPLAGSASHGPLACFPDENRPRVSVNYADRNVSSVRRSPQPT
jgi:hypothetical protein